jgi:hypothetical protein
VSPIEAVTGRTEELALTAHEIITSQEFSYFESADAAKQSIGKAAIEPKDITVTELGYIRVPRFYPETLQEDLRMAFGLLSTTSSQPFLHADRYGVALGHTLVEESTEAGSQLVVSPDGRSCALHITARKVIRYSLLPRQISGTADQTARQLVKLPLGRNILVDEDDARAMGISGRDTAADDSVEQSWIPIGYEDAMEDIEDREWESVLAIGERAVEDMVNYAIDVDMPGKARYMFPAFAGVAAGTIQAAEGFLKFSSTT